MLIKNRRFRFDRLTPLGIMRAQSRRPPRILYQNITAIYCTEGFKGSLVFGTHCAERCVMKTKSALLVCARIFVIKIIWFNFCSITTATRTEPPSRYYSSTELGEYIERRLLIIQQCTSSVLSWKQGIDKIAQIRNLMNEK